MKLVLKLYFQIWLILFQKVTTYSSSTETFSTTELPLNVCSQLVTNSQNTEFLWPNLEQNDTYGYSKPVCLDELKFPKYRYNNNKCMDESKLTCSFAQNISFSTECSNGEPAFVDEYSKICFTKSIQISQIWDYAPCMKYGLNIDFLDMDTTRRIPLLNFVAEKYGKKFWLPLRRERSYQPAQYYMPIMWKKYKTFDWLGIWSFNGDCVSMEIVRSTILLKYDNCNNHYPILCGYNQTNYRKIAYNDKVLVMDTYPKLNKYFYVHPNFCPYGNVSVVDSAEKTQLFQQLLHNSSECTVSVFSSNKSSVPPNIKQYNSTTPCGENCALGITDWVNRLNDIGFVNWKANDIGWGPTVVVDSTGGWKLNNKPLCTVCEDIINPFEIADFFLHQNSNDEIVLVIRVFVMITKSDKGTNSLDNLFNFKDILGVNCFGQYSNMYFENIDMGEIADRNVVSFPIGLVLYTELHANKTDRSGRFWCEGYSTIHNQVFTTNEIYVELGDRTETYAVVTKVSGIMTEIDQARIQYHSNILYQQISSRLMSHGNLFKLVNFKTIISISYLMQEMWAILHFKVVLPNDDRNFPDQLLYYKEILWKALQVDNGTTYTFYGINHTKYCLPETVTIGSTVLRWNLTLQSQMANTQNFDLGENGVPIVRHCHGDFEYGAQWMIRNEMSVLYSNIMTPNTVTKQLFYLENMLSYNSDLSITILKNISTIIKSNRNELISADLFTVSKVLSHLVSSDFSQDKGTQKMDSLSEVTCIMDICIQVNEEVAHNLHTLNTTNALLYSFEQVLSNMIDSLGNNQDELNITATNLAVFVLHPGQNNISGIAVYKNVSKTGLGNDFNDYYVEYILANATQPIFAEGFTIASHIPQDLLENLLQVNEDLQIIITLYYNDVLYQDEENGDELDSIVISVTIPDIPSRLSGIVPFYFTSKSSSFYTLTSNSSLFESNYCSYWSFEAKNETKNSEWSQDGCYFMGFETTVENTTQISICGCKHLTSFAFLIGDLEVTRINEEIIVASHERALDLITLTGCTLSILGVIGIFLTAIVFPTFRRKSGIKILLQLSTAIALQMVLTIFVTTRLIDFEISADMEWTFCLFYGGALHYSVLVVFAWMLISAYLQFNRYVRVFNTKSKHLILISSIVGWIVPLFPVLIAILIAPHSYRAAVINSLNVCYPTDYTLWFAVMLPVALIVAANLTIFVLVMYNIFKMASSKIHAKEKDLIASQLRLSVFLFFLLGLSWIFGLANTLNFGVTFSYLFCLTASVQGMVLFIYFVIMDPETRLLWCNCLTMSAFQDKKI